MKDVTCVTSSDILVSLCIYGQLCKSCSSHIFGLGAREKNCWGTGAIQTSSKYTSLSLSTKQYARVFHCHKYLIWKLTKLLWNWFFTSFLPWAGRDYLPKMTKIRGNIFSEGRRLVSRPRWLVHYPISATQPAGLYYIWTT